MELSEKRRNELSRHVWAVETTQQLTQNSIEQYLSEHGNPGDHGKGNINYKGKGRNVYYVPFFVIEYLVTNKAAQGFQFVPPYHKYPGEKEWHRWDQDRSRRNKITMFGAMMPQHRKHKKK